MITNKLGKISSGSIVYYQPSDGKKHVSLPENTFSNMFSGKAVPLDGFYKMLSVTGKWISQFGIKNSRLFSSGSIQQKNKADKSNQRTSACIDWYLVTTYHYGDGTSSSTSEYVGTTCDGCDSPNEMSLCPDSGGGGSNSTQPDDIEYGNNDASISDSEPTSDLSGSPSNAGNMISVTYTAWCAWAYNRTTNAFVYINPAQPYPVPVSQTFTDDNGKPATVSVSIVEWESLQTLLTYKSCLVQWTFYPIWNYSYTTGPRGPFTFRETFSKVIGPL